VKVKGLIDSDSHWGFKAHIHSRVIGEERVLLLTETGDKKLLHGRLFALIAPFLDGRWTMDEIVHALKDVSSPERTYFALFTLEQKGYIAKLDDGLPYDQRAYWHSLNADLAQSDQRLVNLSIGLLPLDGTTDDATNLSAALAKLNLPVSDRPDADLTVVLVPDYLSSDLAEINQRAFQNQKHWMPLKTVGRLLWMGPLFSPHSRGCWSCLARRLRGNRAEELIVQGASETPVALARAALPFTRSVAVNLAAAEIAKWIMLGSCSVDDSVYTLDFGTLEGAFHRTPQFSDCEICGTPVQKVVGLEEQVRLVLQSRPKRYTADGGHRGCSPEDTFSRLSHLVSPITGIVPDLVKVSHATEFHVFQVKQNLPHREIRTEARLGKKDVAQGKGLSEIQAKVSCLAEAVERYSAIYRGNEPNRMAKFSDLGDAAVHPNTLLNFSPAQFANRVAWNRKNPGFNWVPEPFDEQQEIEWTPNWSLTHARIRWLPRAYCYFVHNKSEKQTYCRGDSNGCASGNTLEEAILQGFLELVERDSVAIFWYNRALRPEVNLESFEDPLLEQTRTHYRNRGRDLVILDITTDLRIPCFVAVSWSRDGGQLLIGLGAHLDARIAASRAVAELNQMVPIGQSWLDSESHEPDDSPMSNWLRSANIENQPYLKPATVPARVAKDFQRLHSSDLLEDVQTCIRIAKDKGLETIVLDLTRGDTNFPTVRVTVPGLRHFWARLAPGRLYDVPVELGWIPGKLTETELNPISFFL
jgi:ribosomal protein S12 methylthiotransferase accessory factor